MGEEMRCSPARQPPPSLCDSLSAEMQPGQFGAAVREAAWGLLSNPGAHTGYLDPLCTQASCGLLL